MTVMTFRHSGTWLHLINTRREPVKG